MTQQNKPILRFKNFSDDWEQRKLEQLAQFNPKSSLPDKFEYVDLESVVGTEMISHRTETKENAPSRAQRLATQGDVFYQTVRPYQKNNYLFDLPHNDYVFSTGYAQLRPFGDSYFLLSRLQDDKFIFNVLQRSTGTSYPAINSSDLSQIEVGVPLVVEEQIKIGVFFKNLDHIIALHQDAIQRQQDLKKALLQKLFPVNGERIPTVRFATFKEEWEQRKVFDMSEITFGGGTPQTGIEDYWQGNFPWIQSSDLKNDQLCNVIPTKFITDEAINKSATKAVPANSIAVVTRVGVGKLALIPYPYATSQDFLSLSNLKVGPWFGVYSLYVLIQKEINNIQGTSIKGMTKSDLLNKNIHIPLSLDEQTKIGNFFKQLDDAIALHQDAIHKLQLLKQSLLQKMFVN